MQMPNRFVVNWHSDGPEPRTPAAIAIFRKTMRPPVSLALGAIFVCIAQCFTLGAWAQGSQHFIHLGRTNIQDPVEIVALRVNGQSVQNGVPFEANGEWIEDISVVIKNRSMKTLKCVQLAIEFPEMRDTSDRTTPLVMTTVTAGVIPEHQLYTKSGQKIDVVQQPPINIGPGQTIEVPISGGLTHVKSFIEKSRPFATLARCDIWIQSAFFADGTKWNLSGVFFRPDSKTLGKYNSISKEEFDGVSTPTAR